MILLPPRSCCNRLGRPNNGPVVPRIRLLLLLLLLLLLCGISVDPDVPIAIVDDAGKSQRANSAYRIRITSR